MAFGGSSGGDIETKFRTTDKHQDWLATGHALLFMNDGIRPFITRKMKKLFDEVKTLAKCTCSYDEGRVNNAYHDMNTCDMAKRLQSCHTYKEPLWHQSDKSKWIDEQTGPWEIAKLFMQELGKRKADVVDASSTDASGLLNILINCNYSFWGSLPSLAKQARDFRNKWAHSATLELSVEEKDNAILAIKNLLSTQPLRGDRDAKTALRSIQTEVEENFDAQKLERQIFHILFNEIKTEVGVLELRIQDFKIGCDGYRKELEKLAKQIQSIKSSLGNRCNEISKDFDNLERRIIKGLDNLERRIQSVEDGQYQNREEIEKLRMQFQDPNDIYHIGRKSLKIMMNFCLNKLFIAICILLISILVLQNRPKPDPTPFIESCPNEDRPWSHSLNQFNLSFELRKGKEDFVGRRWFYDNLNSTLHSMDEQILLPIGDPGSGKTAIITNLICSPTSEYIIAYHLCDYKIKERRKPGSIIKNLVDMIARRSHDYENIIIQNGNLMEILQESNCEGDPYKCFKTAIVDPLNKVFKNSSKLHYIVIDAIDECINEQSGRVTIIDLLKYYTNEFPKSIKFITSTRNDTHVVFPLRKLAKQLYINTSDPRNLQDIELYVNNHLSDSRLTKLAKKAVNISEGNFLVVKLYVDFLKSSNMNSLNFSEIPKDLDMMYEMYFKRAFPSPDNFRQYQGFLNILVASLEPLTVEEIFETVKLQKQQEHQCTGQPDLDKLLSFLRYSEDNTVSLFHKSLVDWLVTPQEKRNNFYFVDKTDGHQKLIYHYKDKIKNNHISDLTDAVLNLAKHIAYGDVVEKYQDEFIKISSQIIQTYTDNKNKSLLHLAASIKNPKVTKLFLPCFDDVDLSDCDGVTPAFLSASHGFLENLKLLVSHGANISHKTNRHFQCGIYYSDLKHIFKTGNIYTNTFIELAKRTFLSSSMLHAAAQGGHLQTVRYLVLENKAIISVSEVNGVGTTAIHLAAENGHLEVVKLLHEKGAKIDQLVLYNAAMNGHKDVVDFLMTKKFVVKCMKCNGSYDWMPGKVWHNGFWITAEDMGMVLSNYRKIFKNRESNKVEQLFIGLFTIMETIVSKAYLMDDQSYLRCETPLHIALMKDHADVARNLILRYKSIVNCPDFNGQTPLHIAARNNNSEIIQILIQAGAKVDSKCTCLDLRLNKVLSRHYSQKRRHRLGGEFKNWMCQGERTPAHIATQFGQIENVKLLLEQSESLSNMVDSNGLSLIHIGACHGQHHVVKWLVNSKGVEINDPSSENGSTPLQNAAACGNIEEIKNLIMDGANVSAIDKNGMTIVHYGMLNADSSCHVLTTIQYIHSDEDHREIYFINKYLTVLKSSLFGMWFFTLQNNDPGIENEFVIIDDNCRDFMELLKYINDSSLLVATDKLGRIPLDMAINSNFPCVSIALMKTMIEGNVVNEELGNRIWKGILENSNFTDQECQWPNLKTALGFMHVKSEKQLTNILLSYLNKRKPIKAVESRLLSMAVPITIKCGVPFVESELHLLSYFPPSNFSNNLINGSKRISGPLSDALSNHSLGRRIINSCRDQEGYTPLQRAAQGGNIIAIEQLLSWGADAKATTRDTNLTALDLAVAFAGVQSHSNTVLNNTVSSASFLLLEKTPNVKVTCDGGATDLTIYHIAAYRGMLDFVKYLLENSKRFGITVDCPDVNGVTPLYLANLSNSTKDPDNPWVKIIKLIESKGGKLQYPSLEAEHHVLYRHDLHRNYMNFEMPILQILNKLLILYRHDPISTCYNEDEIYDAVLYENCIIGDKELQVELSEELYEVSQATNLQYEKAHNDYSKLIKHDMKEFLDTVNKNNRIPVLGNYYELSVEEAISMYILTQIKLELKRYWLTERLLDILDNFLGIYQDITNSVYSKNVSHFQIIKEKLNECERKKMCSRFNVHLKQTYLHISLCALAEKFGHSEKHRSKLIRPNKFTILRSKFTPGFYHEYVPNFNFSRIDDLKALAKGMRYLLDLILNKSTKYDYLRRLEPDTRLLFQQTYWDSQFSTIPKESLKLFQDMFSDKVRMDQFNKRIQRLFHIDEFKWEDIFTSVKSKINFRASLRKIKDDIAERIQNMKAEAEKFNTPKRKLTLSALIKLV